jgi:hypothetical protein
MSYIVKIGTIEAVWNGDNQIPEGFVEFNGDLTDSLVWDSELNNLREKNVAELLNDQRLIKIDLLKTDCTNAIQTGFTSTALGEAHIYDSSLPQDQTNLLGARIAGIDMFFTCTDSNSYKSQKWHTASQMAQVYIAGMVHLQTQKARFYARKLAVEQAETIEAVEAVVW